jgi:glutathionylspermidine amidase/synthetase
MRSNESSLPAKFGTVLGMGPGNVPVYSSDYDSADIRELPNRQAYRSEIDGVFMGHKWQCVELARRYLYLNHGYIFDDIAMAYDIFRLRSVRLIRDDSTLPLKSFRNGSKRHPEPGCLLIWNEGGEFEITGHVAIVTEVFPDRIRLIEQNVQDAVWPEGCNYSREIHATISADGGYWIECSYKDAKILGWVMQTDDATHAELIVDTDPALFNIQARELPDSGAHRETWLNLANADEAAYVEMMGGCLLPAGADDQYKYFCISEAAYSEIKRATNELHALFMHATNFVLQRDELLQTFNIPEALWPRIHQSWDNRRNQMITGRFDFSLSERGLKVFEYNCDSASCHMECGKVQQIWADHFGCDDGHGTGHDLHTDMVDAWRESGASGLLHIMQDGDLEESYHAQYMKAAIERAGIKCKIVTRLDGLNWDENDNVVDADGERVEQVWKTWAWETALDEIRDQIDDDAENLRLHRVIDRRTVSPRLVDVLLRPEVMVYEPLWTLIPSNKAILPVLSMMFPKNRYILNTQTTLTDELKKTGYVSKPIVGRSGANISIYDKNCKLVEETAGRFDNRDQIYQELFPLPVLDGRSVQICTFTVDGAFSGGTVRADKSPIITTNSDIFPLRILSNKEILAAK